MATSSIPNARPLQLKEPLQLDQLKLAQGAPIPAPCSRITFQGRPFTVIGLLDHGHGQSPILLGIP